MILEVCVDDAAGLDAAIAGGADRIELCAALSAGGITPSAGFMRYAAERPVAVSVMIRPRPGDFVFGAVEIDMMKADIDMARAAGVSGVVLGACRSDGGLDETCLSILCRHADGLDLGLHRAFDVAPDFSEAVEVAVSLGFSRILTSGGARSALDALDALEHIVALAKGRISIMPGSGVRPHILMDILQRLNVHEVHASCSKVAEHEPGTRLSMLGFTTPERKETDQAAVRELKSMMETYQAARAKSAPSAGHHQG